METQEELQIKSIEIWDGKNAVVAEAYVNASEELSLLISNGKESAGISLNLERCQQLRKILDLYEQYLGRYDR